MHTLKEFKKKNPNIPTLKSYEGEFPEEFWSKWIKKLPPDQHESWINREKLREIAERNNYKSIHLTKTLSWLEEGARLGCNNPDARLSHEEGPTSHMAFKYGEQVTDSLQEGIKNGTIIGPFTLEELEAVGIIDPKVIPLSARLKPNNTVRLILDGSYPHYRKDKMPPKGTPISMNAGINKKDWPSKMSTFRDVNEVLWSIGYGAEFAKVDWSSAYKHIAVHRDDWRLQVVKWGGRYLCEIMLIFGCTSSPSIFITVTMIPRDIAAMRSGMQISRIPQCVDDVIPCGPKGCPKMRSFIKEYRDFAEEVGIKLATNTGDNLANKCFGISTEGDLLGINFNTENWTWKVPEEKTRLVLHQIKKILDKGEATLEEMDSLIGRMTSYMEVVEGGRWERGFLLPFFTHETRKSKKMKINFLVREQLMWWKCAMLIGRNGWTIRPIKPRFPSHFLNMHCDAAGGSQGTNNGFGGILWLTGARRPWTRGTWKSWIHTGEKKEWGKDFVHALSTLESLAILMSLFAFRDYVRNNAVVNWCDNSGSVFGMLKGRSCDLFLYTVNKAITDLAQGLNCRLEVRKNPRMDQPGDRVADALSKNDIARAKKDWGKVEPSMRTHSEILLKWMDNPQLSRSLGREMLLEIQRLDGVGSASIPPEMRRAPTQKEKMDAIDWYKNARAKERRTHVMNVYKAQREEQLKELKRQRRQAKWWEQ